MSAQRGVNPVGTGSDSHRHAAREGGYTIRWYEDRDRAAFADLYDLAFSTRGEAWFAWKYEQNPYADRVPVIVAEKDGELGAVRPFVPLPLRLGERTVPVIQPVDLVVHPDHRRQGLMTALSRWMKTACWDDYAASFTFATPAARRGILKMQNERWTDHDLGAVVRYERVNNVSAFVGAGHPRAVRYSARVATPVYRTKHRLQDRFTARDSTVTVTRHETVPASLLARLYVADVPAAAHIQRSDTFYGWRFAEPDREFVTYVARRDGTPVAAIVVGTDAGAAPVSSAQLVEVLPLGGGDGMGAVFSSLLARITDDFAAVDNICTTGGAIPHAVLAAHGFTRTDAVPLSSFVDAAYLLVCPLGGVVDDPDATARLTGQDGWVTTNCVRLLG